MSGPLHCIFNDLGSPVDYAGIRKTTLGAKLSVPDLSLILFRHRAPELSSFDPKSGQAGQYAGCHCVGWLAEGFSEKLKLLAEKELGLRVPADQTFPTYGFLLPISKAISSRLLQDAHQGGADVSNASLTTFRPRVAPPNAANA